MAAALHAPLDAFIVRKLGVPGHEEFALGALASGGRVVVNDDVVRGCGSRRSNCATSPSARAASWSAARPFIALAARRSTSPARR
ncbi:putative septum site-determining protein MinD [Mycobacterium kansasii]|uniref:Putative septum site-determining protein MinD n=1 Tax=Mycobacterium kansasii TaxID=1768 RepID=A0A1V3WYX8_MYCKA|nr:putative septum site-determining protein MinD [Mycobacterium kansasii]